MYLMELRSGWSLVLEANSPLANKAGRSGAPGQADGVHHPQEIWGRVCLLLAAADKEDCFSTIHPPLVYFCLLKNNYLDGSSAVVGGIWRGKL
jgi:hypothetical protein